MNASSQVAITGVTGFVGTALAERLRSAGHRVRGLVRSSSHGGTVAWLERLGVELVRGDLGDHAALRRLAEGTDLLVHSAAVIGYRRRLRGAMARTNVLGTRNVVAAAVRAGVGRLVHVSSIAAIGVTDDPVLQDETSPWSGDRLDAAYFDTKHEAELETATAASRGLAVVTVNPGAIYGPSRAVSNSSNVVATIVNKRPGFVPAGGINVVTLETVIGGILAAAQRGRPGRRYVLGGENLHLHELVTRVGAAAELALYPRTLSTWWAPLARGAMELAEPWVPDRVWFTPDMCSCFGRWMWFDNARAREELGVVPDDLDACLRATVEQLRRDRRLPRVG